MAFQRNENEFLNFQLVELENNHFGHTIARNLLFDTFQFLFYQKLIESNNQMLSDIAAKSIKEVKYHLRHSSNWLIRLGDGTDESNKKVQESINEIWKYSGELFEIDAIDESMIKEGIGVDVSLIEYENDWINTKIESNSVLEWCIKQNIKNIIICAPIFHIVRAYMTC